MKRSLLLGFLLLGTALPGFAQNVDEIVDRLEGWMGGAEAWSETRFLTFRFEVDGPDGVAVSRTHYWDKENGVARVEGRTGSTESYTVIVDLETREGRAWIGNRLLEETEADEWVERGYAQWVNDTYWLSAPWKLRDPGVLLRADGEEEIDDRVHDKLHVSFERVGLTPGDQYWLWVDRESGELRKWAYVLEGREPPPTEWLWTNWRELPSGAKLAGARTRPDSDRSIQLRGISAPIKTPCCLFDSLEAPTATTIMTRAIARDAKLIGSGVGGAEITLSLDDGTILDQGVQLGETGDTSLIVTRDIPRDGIVFDTDGAAGFESTIFLDEPAWVTATARGPLDYLDAMTSASKRILVEPGAHVRGEGLILEIHGFIVEITEIDTLDDSARVISRVRMTCGCPTEPGGLWDSNDIRIRIQALGQGEILAEVEAEFTGETSHHGGVVPTPPGTDTIRVIASEPGEANAGTASRPLR